MSWLSRLFGGTRQERTSSSRTNGHSRRSRTDGDSKSRRRRSKSAKADKRKGGRSATAINQQSGQTFSNAFTLAKRELPGIREADAAFVRQARRPTEPEIKQPSAPVRKPPTEGRGPGLRRPN